MDDENQVDPADPAAPLIDVTRMELHALLSSDDTVLAAAVRRILTDLDQGEVIAGFANYPR